MFNKEVEAKIASLQEALDNAGVKRISFSIDEESMRDLTGDVNDVATNVIEDVDKLLKLLVAGEFETVESFDDDPR